MVALVDKWRQVLSNVYVSMVSQDQRAIYVCLNCFYCEIFLRVLLGDSCANFPCKNGAGCASLFTDIGMGWSAYRCTCPPGFYEQNCDTRKETIILGRIFFDYELLI